jgi:periplasmic divalent cation tolerance protein
MDNTPTIGFCTVPDRETGLKIAKTIVYDRLAACGNLLPGVHSVFRWEGKIQEEDELLLIIKTVGKLIKPLQAKIKELHPYEVPEIIFLPIHEGLPAYLKWIADVTEPQ